MEFVELLPEHKKGVEKLFSQLTGHEISNVDVAAMLQDKRNFYAALEEDGQLVGFGALITYRVPSVGEVGRIEDVVIDENYRKKGFGRMLVKKLISIAKEKNLKKINLTSNPQRIAAQKLYETLGFQKRDTDVFVLELA